MVDHRPLGEEGEGVKQLEDGVARLMDGHDDNAFPLLAQAESGSWNSGNCKQSELFNCGGWILIKEFHACRRSFIIPWKSTGSQPNVSYHSGLIP